MANNKEHYSKRELKGADIARDLHRNIGYPGYQKFFQILKTKDFRNCSITSEDAKRYLSIYSPDEVILKRKMTKPSASKIKKLEQIKIPRTTKDTHPTVNISEDFLSI